MARPTSPAADSPDLLIGLVAWLTMPHILITNDDGIHAEGLRALAEGLAGLGRLSIVAPSRERSAAAQSLTLRQPIICELRGENEWAVEGTPADAVIVALHKLLPAPPALVGAGV
ncbi:MAG TPA: 5'/3'-nucleotidase SurE, partial [Candidatus Acidoferrales bacterium]|nr:5'/3'-nucleotidase SurE [Candidatus Acidoferrales bacterium]